MGSISVCLKAINPQRDSNSLLAKTSSWIVNPWTSGAEITRRSRCLLRNWLLRATIPGMFSLVPPSFLTCFSVWFPQQHTPLFLLFLHGPLCELQFFLYLEYWCFLDFESGPSSCASSNPLLRQSHFFPCSVSLNASNSPIFISSEFQNHIMCWSNFPNGILNFYFQFMPSLIQSFPYGRMDKRHFHPTNYSKEEP